MEFLYELFIQPEACFLLKDDVAAGSKGIKLELGASPGLTTSLKQLSRGKAVVINDKKVPNCFDRVLIKAKVIAPEDQPLGMKKIMGRIMWQGRNAQGVMEPQTTKFEFPIEVVEHGDRTAKYNESYAYHLKVKELWLVPAAPFIVVYCIASGNCPD